MVRLAGLPHDHGRCGLLLGLFLSVRSGRAFTETWGTFVLDISIENVRQPRAKWP